MDEALIEKTERIRKKQAHQGGRSFACDKCEDSGFVLASTTLDGKDVMQPCTCHRAPKSDKSKLANLPSGVPTPYRDVE